MNVFILATCRKPKLLPYTTLVFDTLRVGFPTATIGVYLNNLDVETSKVIVGLANKIQAGTKTTNTIHHKWIESLIESEQEPFWICDTDVVFYNSFEQLITDKALAGCRIPEWQDEFSGAITRSRLHPSLLYINPALVKSKLAEFRAVCPDSPFTPFCNPIYPLCLPLNNRMYFHDTCSLLYHAIGGQSFTDIEKDKYFHFNFGTIPDLVLPRLKDADKMIAARQVVLDNPELGRGAWRFQDEYYASKQPSFSKNLSLPQITSEDAKSALEWNINITKGDREAMAFNDQWYRYVHGIDDLIDTMQDGRAQMSQDQIIGLFLNAAFLYNTPFFIRHRNLLFPIVLSITNTFANSVAWEKSSLNRRRIMADVWRTCGDEMYDMVAMIVGGWNHVRVTSPLIRDRDWIGQHDTNDKPN
jgi:hypothetical protein